MSKKMIKCVLCAREFEVEETFELNPRMDVDTGEIYYECPDCCGDVREVTNEQYELEENKRTRPDKRERRASRNRKAFY